MNDKKKKCKIMTKFAIFTGIVSTLVGILSCAFVSRASTPASVPSIAVGGVSLTQDNDITFTYDNYYYLRLEYVSGINFTPNTAVLTDVTLFNRVVNNFSSNQIYSVGIEYVIADNVARSEIGQVIDNFGLSTTLNFTGNNTRYANVCFNLDTNCNIAMHSYGDDFILYLRVPYSSNISLLSENGNCLLYFDSRPTDTIFSYYFQLGYNEGYEAGANSSSSDAYNRGYNTGYQAGLNSVDTQTYYNNGYNVGYNIGYEAGTDSVDTQTYYNNGYRAGLNDGRTQSSRISYNNGYQAGLNDANAHQVTNAKSLIWNIASIPFETLKNVFNFEILGINVAGFILGIITISFVIFLLKKFL